MRECFAKVNSVEEPVQQLLGGLASVLEQSLAASTLGPSASQAALPQSSEMSKLISDVEWFFLSERATKLINVGNIVLLLVDWSF